MLLQLFQSGGVWTVLSMLTDTGIVKDLADNRIHHLENILSMNFYCRQLFDDLYLWLKPVGVRLPSPSRPRVLILFNRVYHTCMMCA